MSEYATTQEAGVIIGIKNQSTIKKYVSLLARFCEDFPPVEKVFGKSKYYRVDKLKAFAEKNDAYKLATQICNNQYKATIRDRKKNSADFEYAKEPEFEAVALAKSVKGNKAINKQFIAGEFAPRPLKMTNKIKRITAKHFAPKTTKVRVTGWN